MQARSRLVLVIFAWQSHLTSDTFRIATWSSITSGPALCQWLNKGSDIVASLQA